MTTDLTGDFELGEDEFEWDVFLPDPDEADVEAEAAALEDEAALSLDESEFDWDGALRDDAGAEPAADGGARAGGAAYDRIVDTVRRSFDDDEEPSTDAAGHADSDPDANTIAFDSVDQSEAQDETAREAVGVGFATSVADEVEPEAEVHPVVAWAPEAVLEPDDESAGAIDLEADANVGG